MPAIITIRDAVVNTNRVRRAQSHVNNGGMAFGDRLKYLRVRAKLTQEQLAHKCGWSGQSRIGNYENVGPAGREPKLDELPTIAKALGVSISALVDEQEFRAFKNAEGKPLSPLASVTNILVRQRAQPAAKSDASDSIALLKLILQQMRSVKGLSSKQRDTLILKIFSLYIVDDTIPAPAKVLQLIRSA